MNLAGKLRARLGLELRELTRVQTTDRVWQMPFAAALANGLPVLIGAYFDHLDYGLVASLGGLVFLYLPPTPMHHRMVMVLACAFGMVSCYTLGLLSHLLPWLMGPVLFLIAVLVTMVCRFYAVAPPGSLFFIMAASIGAYSPVPLAQIPLMTGLFTMGCLLSCAVALFYSLVTLRLRKPIPVAPLREPSFNHVIFDSVVIGLFVSLSLAAAQLLALHKAYWVAVSCLAVIQGASLRAVWNKQLQRVLGTAVGLLLSWAILLLPLDRWTIALAMMVLTFVIEMTVVRHYAFAVVFITPLTILLAEAATLGQGSSAALIQARFLDTVLGSLIGLLGAVCLHSPRLRLVAGTRLRAMFRWQGLA